MSRLRDGFMVTPAGDVFALVAGAPFQVEPGGALADLEPGYYTNELEPVPKAEAEGEQEE